MIGFRYDATTDHRMPNDYYRIYEAVSPVLEDYKQLHYLSFIECNWLAADRSPNRSLASIRHTEEASPER